MTARPSALAPLAALAALAAVIVVLTGCGAPGSAAPSASGRTTLTVFAAASLTGAMEQLRTEYERARPDTTLVLSTDSSAALVTQIEQGAPADVFLSADVTNAKRLVDRGLADGDVVAFAGNELAVVVPTDNPADLQTPADLAAPGVRIIAAGDQVPISTYARQVLERLATEPGYPADLPAAYARNIVSREDNVKAVMAKIELGEGDAAMVYGTDAKASAKVTILQIPAAANVRAVYAGAVVKGKPNVAAAHAFLAWMTGPEAQRHLSALGFTPPP